MLPAYFHVIISASNDFCVMDAWLHVCLQRKLNNINGPHCISCIVPAGLIPGFIPIIKPLNQDRTALLLIENFFDLLARWPLTVQIMRIDDLVVSTGIKA